MLKHFKVYLDINKILLETMTKIQGLVTLEKFGPTQSNFLMLANFYVYYQVLRPKNQSQLDIANTIYLP